MNAGLTAHMISKGGLPNVPESDDTENSKIREMVADQ